MGLLDTPNYSDTPQPGLLPSGLGNADNSWAQDAQQEAYMRQQVAMMARGAANPYAPVPPEIAPMKPVAVSREAEKLMGTAAEQDLAAWEATYGQMVERKEDLCLCTKNLWS